jgi:hypothetical protein
MSEFAMTHLPDGANQLRFRACNCLAIAARTRKKRLRAKSKFASTASWQYERHFRY